MLKDVEGSQLMEVSRSCKHTMATNLSFADM